MPKSKVKPTKPVILTGRLLCDVYLEVSKPSIYSPSNYDEIQGIRQEFWKEVAKRLRRKLKGPTKKKR